MNSCIFEVLPTGSRKKVGVATLNQPQALNGLSLDMCQQLYDQLTQWECDSSIALVILRGAGDKAFSAGGDLRTLYQTMLDNVSGRPWDNAYARNFFTVEYQLDHRIHTYSKPVVCWASGIVMGGGVGLMMGASHRVVSNTTRFAMPEISIGLFPDVGGSWMLNRMPAGIGLFLALTGSQLGEADCRYLGLADYRAQADAWPDLIQAIQAGSWSDSRVDNDVRLHHALRALQAADALPAGPLERHHVLINDLCSGPDFDAICDNLTALSQHGDAWLQKAGGNFCAGSPGSARLCFTLLNKTRHLSLPAVFQLEYIVALQGTVMGDFQEGIRALIIDKDKAPVWHPPTLAAADKHWVERFFIPPWPEGGLHPLADLGLYTPTPV